MTKKLLPRMCIVCRNMFPKEELIRIVKRPDGGFAVDATGKANGRGYYICKQKECIDKLLNKKLLGKIIKEEIPDSLYEELRNIYNEE